MVVILVHDNYSAALSLAEVWPLVLSLLRVSSRLCLKSVWDFCVQLKSGSNKLQLAYGGNFKVVPQFNALTVELF
jgi:hypothetical protein